MIGITAAFLFLCLFVWLMLGLSKEADEIHKQLEHFMERARLTDDKEVLRGIHSGLVKYAKEKCWHRAFGSHVMEVSGFIRGKIEKKI